MVAAAQAATKDRWAQLPEVRALVRSGSAWCSFTTSERPNGASHHPAHFLLFFRFSDFAFFRIRFALETIFSYAADESLPFLSCCLARPFALAAWLLSGIGYLRAPGSPYCDFLSLRSFSAIESS